jgi:signal transduction histidine kinase
MAHIGLTPQAVHGLGSCKVQGEAKRSEVLDEALALEKAGAFAVVLEAMPAELGAEITRSLEVPTIGIGAGPGCDAQVLVLADVLGLSEKRPKLAKAYADLRGTVTDAVTNFVSDVEGRRLPRRRPLMHVGFGPASCGFPSGAGRTADGAGRMPPTLPVGAERGDDARKQAELVSMVSHELRGPISTIKGLAVTTRTYYDQLPDEEKREFLG